jgi:hypothetical protein
MAKKHDNEFKVMIVELLKSGSKADRRRIWFKSRYD